MDRISEGGAPSASATAAPAAGSGRLTLLLIAGIPVTVILAASWMWYFVVNGRLDVVGALGTANHGELVRPPRHIGEAGWTSPDGEALDLAARETAHWTLIVPQASASCDERCEARLYETRQIHMALGKEMGRVERMLVTPARSELRLAVDALSDARPLPDDFAAYLARDQRGLTLWRSDAEAFEAVFAELPEAPDSWYLMDPAGWVMMRYDATIDYKNVISDLKFLIKNSNG